MAVATTEKRGPGGRPALDRKGEVDARLLEAATRLFLTLGFDATSCDQVALDARAGKASIYARYANKAALFAAVIDNQLVRLVAPADASAAPGAVRLRLAATCMRVLEDALQADTVALLRLLVAEVPRFADMGLNVDQIWRQLGVQRLADAIAGQAGEGALRASAEQLAQQLADLVLAPCLMRAMLGEQAGALLTTAPARIDQAIALLSATGALDAFD